MISTTNQLFTKHIKDSNLKSLLAHKLCLFRTIFIEEMIILFVLDKFLFESTTINIWSSNFQDFSSFEKLDWENYLHDLFYSA
jgi:hypothetical protein